MFSKLLAWWRHQMETFPRYWPFVRGFHRSPVNPQHKGQWRGALMFSLIWPWINGWVNNRDAGDLGRHRAHYDVIVMVRNNLGIGSLVVGETRRLHSHLTSLLSLEILRENPNSRNKLDANVSWKKWVFTTYVFQVRVSNELVPNYMRKCIHMYPPGMGHVGLVTNVRLSCYLALLSNDSKPAKKTGPSLWPGVGVTKAPFFWSHPYLTGVTAAEWWWHLPNINVIFNS